MSPRYLRHGEVLRRHLALAGARVLDIGCGAGALARAMARHGAEVVGLEAGEGQLRAALGEPAQAGERYLRAVAERLPLRAASFDAAVFFNSLHHVEPPVQDRALAEAARVLRADGTLYVCEPLAEGSGFELHRPVDDETAVRAAAYQALRRCPRESLEQVAEERYLSRYTYRDFAAFRAEFVRVDPRRRERFDARASELETGFLRLGAPCERGFRFDQPMRVNVLRRR